MDINEENNPGIIIFNSSEVSIDTWALELKMHRENMLQGSDWTQLPDSPLSDSKKAEWGVYRQGLRDITSHENWPEITLADFPSAPT